LIDTRIEINEEELAEIRKKLGKLQAKAPIALYRAINEAVSKARKETKDAIAARYNIRPNKDILPTLSISKANSKKLWAALKSKGAPIALTKFKVNPTSRARRLKGGKGYKPPVYKADVKKETGERKLNGNPKAFIAVMKSGHKAVMERVSKRGESLPLKELYGPSAPSMMKNDEVMEQIKESASETLQKRLDHQIQYILQKG